MTAGLIDMSLNEVETLAAKAARGAGLSWGGAEEFGRAARLLATAGRDWPALVTALAGTADDVAAEAAALARCEATLEAAGLGAPGSGVATRAAVAPATLAALEALAARTYVPASAQSRVLGAGAGLTDND
ncbi:MAG: DUF3726 domain-containing protein [Phreatobacter sp.]|uniref:DUF3726 domain-containing protein n=1 Tax=Phreatobacter sp. TaxID=1966341 RepID=UPI0027354208|nr:DUF3726 domain-containing protein [Phreatobacter sp.]MDP2802192.1 DUF3726 domain-containing protein [Phreatobacter sp.]